MEEVIESLVAIIKDKTKDFPTWIKNRCSETCLAD